MVEPSPEQRDAYTTSLIGTRIMLTASMYTNFRKTATAFYQEAQSHINALQNVLQGNDTLAEPISIFKAATTLLDYQRHG